MTGRATPAGSTTSSSHSIVHASCVAVNGRAALIMGASGRGKSALALQMMALGAGLVSDDRTCLDKRAGQVFASAPAAISGRIEARFVGILAAEQAGPQPVALVVDLDRIETERLPPLRYRRLFDVEIPLLHNVETGHFPASLMQYLKAGPMGEVQ